ncbi:MAG: hypothetical protein IC227_04425 [Enterococcus lacertideformus]|uniref:Flagellar motor switch protein n=1 Tax=Enterococcus lacertideformus TaxID=2771493 RepID=A0A931FAT0_9ENTE|nr:hypothetical protein [Enterococcus lacertideformus]
METEEQRRKRKAKKKIEMQRLCQMLDIEGWEQNEAILNEVRAIVQLGKPKKKKPINLSRVKILIFDSCKMASFSAIYLSGIIT